MPLTAQREKLSSLEEILTSYRERVLAMPQGLARGKLRWACGELHLQQVEIAALIDEVELEERNSNGRSCDAGV